MEPSLTARRRAPLLHTYWLPRSAIRCVDRPTARMRSAGKRAGCRPSLGPPPSAQRVSFPGSLSYATSARHKLSPPGGSAPLGAGFPRLSREDWRVRERNEGRKCLSPAPHSPNLATWAINQPGRKPRKSSGFCGGKVAELVVRMALHSRRTAKVAVHGVRLAGRDWMSRSFIAPILTWWTRLHRRQRLAARLEECRSEPDT